MKISFFCKTNKPDSLQLVDFYRQDIEALQELDPHLVIATKWRQIDWHADIIFVWWWTYAFIPVLIAKILRKKVVITGTFNYKAPQAAIDYFRRPFYQRCLIRFSTRWADANILVSKNEYEAMTREWGYKNLLYSPHGVYTEKYTPSILPRGDFFFSICWLQKTNVYRKCLYESIEAFKILLPCYPDLQFWVAGQKGDAWDELQQFIVGYGLQDNVKLLGEISEEEKVDLYQKCFCYIQPSRYEGFGLAIAEALSCGTPVITTSAGELGNVVGDAGIILESIEPQEIANKMEQLILGKISVAELSERARNQIETNFSVIERKESLKKIINNILYK
ncbi:glycosyltransferase family 4 protein [Bacteroides sp. HPS0048]|uniref:glycosyltransferase family 4 protein n=1 Tax=Bacteroides sp. HPS0048 TaxID=1078089 RepID=UPI003563F7EE